MGPKPSPHMVRNNVFHSNLFAGNDPGGDGLSLYLGTNIATDNRFKHNLFFGDKPGTRTIRYGDWQSRDRWPGKLMTPDEANAAFPEQFVGNSNADPRFVNAEKDDYRLTGGSPAIDAGRPLAAAREAGSGRTLPVDDARWFYDGFGIPGETGDLLFIGEKRLQARVVNADIQDNVLTLDRDLTWEKGDSVTLPYSGKAPDAGAYEFGAEKEPWYAAPQTRSESRIETMETADKPVVVTDFEPENPEEWFYYWYFHRQRNTDARLDDATAASGKRSMRVFATDDGANMGALIRPPWWDVDRFPYAIFSYRIPRGVPVGIWLCAFPSEKRGTAMVCVGGSPARKSAPSKDLKKVELLDDDQWHEVTVDVRAIREVFPEVNLLRTFYFYTRENGKKGQQYWFDNFRITREKAR